MQKMKYYASRTRIKRMTILNTAGGGSDGCKSSMSTPRISGRVAFALVLLFGALLPFIFVRIAFLVLESPTISSSSLDCIRMRLYNRNNASMRLRNDLSKALIEASRGGAINGGDKGNVGVPVSFKDLVKGVILKGQDLNTFSLKARDMLLKLESDVYSAKRRESIYWHLASRGIPNSLHCLSLLLAEEYAVNSKARSLLPMPEFVSRLSDHCLQHVVVLTDNILAASVVASSTVRNSANPEKLVFHIITDKKTYAPMHAWFALNSLASAVLEVKGLHQFDMSEEVNNGVREMLGFHRLTWLRYYHNLRSNDDMQKNFQVFHPNYLSLLKILRIYLPELFPDLSKVVLLDDDMVVQQDLSPLWEVNLDGKVNGAVLSSCFKHDACPERKYKHYLNFSNPIISSNFSPNHAAWLPGMNVLDLQAWRKTNITQIYSQWIKLNLDSEGRLWLPGALPPVLIAFHGYVHPMSCSWHVFGLGSRPQIPQNRVKNGSVLHFSGPAKPWLAIGFPELRDLWHQNVNFSNGFIRKCRIMR